MQKTAVAPLLTLALILLPGLSTTAALAAAAHVNPQGRAVEYIYPFSSQNVDFSYTNHGTVIAAGSGNTAHHGLWITGNTAVFINYGTVTATGTDSGRGVYLSSGGGSTSSFVNHGVLAATGTHGGQSRLFHEFGDTRASLTAQAKNAAFAFSTNGQDMGRDTVRLGAGPAWMPTECLRLNLTYDFTSATHYAGHDVGVQVRLEF